MSLVDKRFLCLSVPPVVPTDPPVITLQPLDVTADEGVPWSITSTATGATSSEWYKDAVATGNSTNTFSGTGLTTESGSYLNRYTNIIGSTDTSAALVSVGSESRVIVQIATASTSHLEAEAWNPTGERSISVDFARTSNGSYILIAQDDMYLSCIPQQGRYTLTPNANVVADIMDYTGNTPLAANEINTIELRYQHGLTASSVVLLVNGVALTPTTTTTRAVSASGVVRFGARFTTKSNSGQSWLSNIKLKDSNANTITWPVDEATSNTEDSVEGGNTLTYSGIATGLPEREEFTFTADEWIGNNSTVLTVG